MIYRCDSRITGNPNPKIHKIAVVALSSQPIYFCPSLRPLLASIFASLQHSLPIQSMHCVSHYREILPQSRTHLVKEPLFELSAPRHAKKMLGRTTMRKRQKHAKNTGGTPARKCPRGPSRKWERDGICGSKNFRVYRGWNIELALTCCTAPGLCLRDALSSNPCVCFINTLSRNLTC